MVGSLVQGWFVLNDLFLTIGISQMMNIGVSSVVSIVSMCVQRIGISRYHTKCKVDSRKARIDN